MIIDSIRISTYGVNLKYEKLIPQQAVVKEFISNYKGHYEGAFSISVYVKDSLKSSGTFGYFPDKSSMQKLYTVTIYDDFKFKESLPMN